VLPGSSPGRIFPKAIGYSEARKTRIFAVNDIVIRAGVISPDRIILHNYPTGHPISAFNAGAIYDEKEEALKTYVRIILGYYMYVSSIIEIEVPLQDIFSGYINTNRYPGDIVIYPSTKYDIWGTEDPRVYVIDDKLFMTYTGRTINYFSPTRRNRTLPVTAVYDQNLKTWIKRYVFTLSPKIFDEVVSNKDAFLYKTEDERLYLFHRPHLADETFHLVLSNVDKELLDKVTSDISEVYVDNAVEVLSPAKFESKLGWATPPITLTDDRIIVFVHGVDKDSVVYRVFAIQLLLRKDEIIIEAITPRYIMEPRTPYEIVGDRPLTVFPCGAVKLDRNKIILTYGAGDFMVGIGIINLDELLAELDKGRIY